MDYYMENAQELPQIAQVDTLVAGGGPAGIGAAIRAGRFNAKTMTVECFDCLEGMTTR